MAIQHRSRSFPPPIALRAHGAGINPAPSCVLPPSPLSPTCPLLPPQAPPCSLDLALLVLRVAQLTTPQGLCTCSSLCLEHCYCRFCTAGSTHPGLSMNIPSSPQEDLGPPHCVCPRDRKVHPPSGRLERAQAETVEIMETLHQGCCWWNGPGWGRVFVEA